MMVVTMSSKLTRSAYENLITEDIKWLLEQERTLERDHILDVLMDSPGNLYDFDEVNHETFRGLPQSRINDTSVYDRVQMRCPLTVCITQYGDSKCYCKLKLEQEEEKK